MNRAHFAAACVATLVLLPQSALAQESSAASAAPAETTAATPAAPASRAGGRFVLGVDLGVWGGGFGQGVRFDWFFLEHFGVRLRGLMAYGPAANPDFDPVLFGGAQLVGRSGVVNDLFRIYGGGGVFAGGRPARPAGDLSDVGGISGGGFFGVEFFAVPNWSVSIEIGGQGAVHAHRIDAGPSVMGGFATHF